jgi:hypothetical protein
MPISEVSDTSEHRVATMCIVTPGKDNLQMTSCTCPLHTNATGQHIKPCKLTHTAVCNSMQGCLMRPSLKRVRAKPDQAWGWPASCTCQPSFLILCGLADPLRLLRYHTGTSACSTDSFGRFEERGQR